MLTLSAALDQLQTGDFHARWDVAKTLPSFGEPAVNPLIQLLQAPDTDPDLQWMIAKTLGEFTHSSALAALGTILHTTDDEDLLQIATQTLARKGVAAIPALTGYVRDRKMAVAAIQALAQIRDPQVIPSLLQGVDAEQAEVRAAALEALSLWHDPQITPLLLAGLQDRSSAVRQVAVTALGYRAAALDHDDLVQHLTSALEDINPTVGQQAILALGNLATAAATQTLIAALQPDRPPAHRLLLIQALGRIGSESAVQALQRAWASEQLDVQGREAQAIVAALARVEDASGLASQVLAEILLATAVTAVRLRCMIANSLGQLGQPEAMSPLITLLADRDMGVRLHAIAALKCLNPQHIHAHLQTLTTNPDLAAPLRAGIEMALLEW